MASKDKITLPNLKPLLKPLSRIAIWGGLILALLIVLFLIMDHIVMPMYTRHGTEFPLPNLLNMSFDEASNLADKYDFEIVVQGKQPSPTIPEGTILSQVPAGGTQIKENRKVKVIISAGEEMIQVPDLSRLSIRNAELKLPEYGLKVQNYYWTESDTLARDVVAYTIPPAESLVPKGSGIDLYINRGRQTEEGYVPKLLGKPMEQAVMMLDTLGFPEPRVEYVSNPLLLPAIVTYQHPAAGTKMIIDSTRVVLVVPMGD